MYQKCPVCRGKGIFKKETCPVCLGEHVIHEDYGTPPSKNVIPYVVAYPYIPSTLEPPYYVTVTNESPIK